jgi:Ca-activated chloride channel family protein
MSNRWILWQAVMMGTLVAGAVTLSAQSGDAPGVASHTSEAAHVYKSEASVVALGVTVTDAQQRQIRGLVETDFAIFEDGRPQELRYFAADPTPIDLAILLDTSGSMSTTLGDVQQAALQLAGALRSGDRASFAEVKRGMNELHPLSADTSGLAHAIRATTPGGSTGLFDAIYITLDTLRRAAPAGEVRRQALVLLSDGNDTTSILKYDDVLERVQHSGVTVYAVSLRPPGTAPSKAVSRLLMGESVNGDYVLRSLAEQTGGRAFFEIASKDLARTCRRIADELAEQYSLGYVSSNSQNDGRFRQVSVRVAARTGVCARTRPGYFATSTLSRTPDAR